MHCYSPYQYLKKEFLIQCPIYHIIQFQSCIYRTKYFILRKSQCLKEHMQQRSLVALEQFYSKLCLKKDQYLKKRAVIKLDTNFIFIIPVKKHNQSTFEGPTHVPKNCGANTSHISTEQPFSFRKADFFFLNQFCCETNT